jgi:hypothetical protein
VQTDEGSDTEIAMSRSLDSMPDSSDIHIGTRKVSRDLELPENWHSPVAAWYQWAADWINHDRYAE